MADDETQDPLEREISRRNNVIDTVVVSDTLTVRGPVLGYRLCRCAAELEKLAYPLIAILCREIGREIAGKRIRSQVLFRRKRSGYYLGSVSTSAHRQLVKSRQRVIDGMVLRLPGDV